MHTTDIMFITKKFGVYGKENKKSQFWGEVEAYIYQHTPLYKNNSVELSLI